VPTYLYGLILSDSADRVPRDVRGIGAGVVRVLTGRVLSAVVGTVDAAPERATLELVTTHDAVLQAVVNAGITTAAARFRQTFADDDDARRHVEEHGERIARVLQEYAGCVEMRVLLRDTDPLAAGVAVPSAARISGPGQAYLEQVRAQHARVTHLALAPMLGPMIQAERVSMLPDDRGVVFAHLVKRDRVPGYRDAIQGHPALAHATVVGPLALYSFAEPEP